MIYKLIYLLFISLETPYRLFTLIATLSGNIACIANLKGDFRSILREKWQNENIRSKIFVFEHVFSSFKY